VKKLSKEPNGVLVMTTCKCRENNTNIVMTRTWFDETLQNKIEQGVRQEQQRIIELLTELINQRPEDWTHAKGFWFEDVISLIKGETK